MPKKGTISICFVNEALVEARRRGRDVAALLTRAGIPAQRLEQGFARVSPRQYGALWKAMASDMGDEFFGMDSRPIRPGSFSLLCHALTDCENLQHALKRMLQYFSSVHGDVSGQLSVTDLQPTLTLVDRRKHSRIFMHATIFILISGLASWLIGRRLPVLEVAFAKEAPAHADEYRLIFGDGVRFGQAASRLLLNPACLSLPLLRDRLPTREFISQAPAIFLVRYRNQSGPVTQVRAQLRRLAPAEWPNFAVVAAAMHTTPSTLRRRLEKEGSSYQAIKDDLRRDLAIQLLGDSRMTVRDIANELGFAEHSAFHRAFRAWTGARPSDYRQRMPTAAKA